MISPSAKPPGLDQSDRKRPGNRALLLLGAIATLAVASCRSTPSTIRAGLLLDGRGGQLRDALVTVVDGRIRAIGPYQAGPVTYDLSRYTVLPGLIDAHVHITGYINRFGKVGTGDDGETRAQRVAGGAANALATLRAGFTTVASMGSDADKELRDAIESGSIPGPRVLTSLTPFRDTTLTPEELRRQVRGLKARGADFIKIFGSNTIREGGEPVFSAEQLSALCGEARRLKLRSVVHVQSDASIRAATAAGCDAVEHGALATPEGLRLLAQSGLDYDPQCSLVLTNYLENRARLQGISGFDSTSFAIMERLVPTFPRLIHSAVGTPGLRLIYGTDATAGAHGRNAEDLVCRVREAGQLPMDALITATSRNAIALGLGTRIGTIAPGYEADLIALDGDPLREIEAVRWVKFVMKGGKVYLKP